VIPLRLTEEELAIGDVAIHEEEIYPSETLTAVGRLGAGGSAPPPDESDTVSAEDTAKA
jgi:hypothetical protein